MQSRFITVNGIRTHYLEAGPPERPTVLLLHGAGIDAAHLSWTPLIEALADDFHLIAPDFPGYGQSDFPADLSGLDYMVAFTRRFVDALNLPQPFDLAGISMGGGTALGYALGSPHSIRRLVLVDSYGLQDKAPYHQLSYLFLKTPGLNSLSWKLFRIRSLAKWSLSSLLANPQAVTPELVDLAHTELLRPNAGKAMQIFQNSETGWQGQRTVYMDRLEELTMPVLVIHGEKDGLVPLRCSQEAARRLPNARLEVIAGAGHWPQRDRPAEFNRLVGDFLRG